MTIQQARELKAAEIKKFEALEQIIAILEGLDDQEAADWVIERLQE